MIKNTLHTSSFAHSLLCYALLCFSLTSCSLFFSDAPVSEDSKADQSSATESSAQSNQTQGAQASNEPQALPFKDQASKPQASVKVETQQVAEKLTRSDIEVVWAASSIEPDGFILRYGYEKDQLDFEKRISLQDLVKSQDLEHGTLYKYLIQDVPADRHVYFTISTVKGQSQSAPSQIFEVE